MILRRLAALVAIAATAAACGTTIAPVEGGRTGGEPVTVTAATGEEVTLPGGPATRVVALEWEFADILSSIGAGQKIVGLSDVKGYDTFSGPTVPLSTRPQDVGNRLEPSLETIAGLQPDLIIASARSIPDSVRGQLAGIAPILVLTLDDPADPLGQIAETTRTLGQVTGAQDAAEELNTRLKDALARNAKTITASGHRNQHAVFAYLSTEASTTSIRLHVPGSAAEAVLAEMGFEPAWTDPAAVDGTTYLDVEGLTRLPADTWFFYWDEAAADPITAHLSDNSVWRSLPFVQAGDVAGTSLGVWMYGGPASLIAFSDQVATAVTRG